MIRHRADEDALRELGDKLSKAVEEKNPKMDSDLEEPEEDIRNSKPSEPALPDAPEPPRTDTDNDLPDLGPTPPPSPPFHEEEEKDDIEDLKEAVKELSQSVKSLIDNLNKEVTTMVVPGNATLSGGKEESHEDEQEYGFEPVVKAYQRARRESMRKTLAAPPKFRMHKSAMGPTGAGTEGTEPTDLEGILGAPETAEVEGSKDFVSPPKTVSEEQMEADTKAGKESNLGKLLYESSAQRLRRSRLARLGLSIPPGTGPEPVRNSSTERISAEARQQIWELAEKKASDIAALKRAQFRRAMELAFVAQEKGILNSPLLEKLTAALVDHDVPDAAQIAADVLSGANAANFRVACEQAEKYMSMTDREFLAVAATVKKAPPLNASVRTASTTTAEELERGNIHVQASGPSGTRDIREILRMGSPRPLSRT